MLKVVLLLTIAMAAGAIGGSVLARSGRFGAALVSIPLGFVAIFFILELSRRGLSDWRTPVLVVALIVMCSSAVIAIVTLQEQDAVRRELDQKAQSNLLQRH